MTEISSTIDPIFRCWLSLPLTLPTSDPHVSDIDLFIETNVLEIKCFQIESNFTGEWLTYPIISSRRLRDRISNIYKSFSYRITALDKDQNPLTEIEPVEVLHNADMKNFSYGMRHAQQLAVRANWRIEHAGESIAIIYKDPIAAKCSCYNFQRMEADTECPICHGMGTYEYGLIYPDGDFPKALIRQALVSMEYTKEGRIPEFVTTAEMVGIPKLSVTDVIIRKDPWGYGLNFLLVDAIERATIRRRSSLQVAHVSEIGPSEDQIGLLIPRDVLQSPPEIPD